MALSNTNFGASQIEQLLQTAKGIWFLGVGGISMSALAEATIKAGFRVGGDDRVESSRTIALRQKGCEVRIASDAPVPEWVDLLVYTVAIQVDNLQFNDACVRKIPCISRADYLGCLLSRFQNRIGIAGMHGKSTCTAMCAQILLHSGDPTIFAGAELPVLGGNCCRIGEGREIALFEACEYMDSFLHLSPSLAVVLNIGMDHVDYFHSMEQVRQSFCKFADLAGEEHLLWNLDDPESRITFTNRPAAKTFSIRDPAADFYAANICADHGTIRFLLVEKQGEGQEISLPAVGLHNVYNALAAAAAARLSGVLPDQIAQALKDYRGAARRTEFRGYLNGCPVYDDYAHHPDEIKATVSGIRALVPEGGRLVLVYQPHTYTRTAGFFHAFSQAFDQVDLLLLADIYAAREKNQSGVTSQQLAKAIRKRGKRVLCCGSVEQTAQIVGSFLRAKDLLVIMGAGDIESIFRILPLSK